MVAEIIQLRRTVCTPFGHVIRSGEGAYRKLEHLHRQGRPPAQAVIVDASASVRQPDLARVRTGEATMDRTLSRNPARMERMARVYEMLAEEKRPTPLPPAWLGVPAAMKGGMVA